MGQVEVELGHKTNAQCYGKSSAVRSPVARVAVAPHITTALLFFFLLCSGRLFHIASATAHSGAAPPDERRAFVFFFWRRLRFFWRSSWQARTEFACV
jgi:hypothetical protein